MCISGFPTLPRNRTEHNFIENKLKPHAGGVRGLGFCPDPKYFIVNCEQNIVKYAEKMGENIVKNAISI